MLIVGAGVVGACAALGLAARGVRVSLVEAAEPPRFDPARDDLRVFAVSPASLAVLERVGALAVIRATRWSPYRAMRVWQDDPVAALEFDAHLIAHDRLGAIVEDGLLRDALWQRVLAEPRIERCCPATVAAVNQTESSVTVSLVDGRQLHADVLIGADGSASAVRTLLGVALDQRDYEVRAIVAHVRTGQSHQATAWQRFTPEGPLAFLPLSDGRCSIVWSSASAARLLQLGEEAFREALGEAFQFRLGPIVSCGPRASFPLRRQLATPSARGRAVLIGDAAHAVHPLAGQGLNLGMLDAAALVDCVAEAESVESALRRFTRWRDSDNARAALMFEGLNDLFGDGGPGMPWLRQLGMGMVQRLSPLRREFALHAAGWVGEVPKLARR